MQWTGINTTELLHWIFLDIEPDATADGFTEKTLKNVFNVIPGDWIIRDPMGRFYSCPSNIFEMDYESVE